MVEQEHLVIGKTTWAMVLILMVVIVGVEWVIVVMVSVVEMVWMISIHLAMVVGDSVATISMNPGMVALAALAVADQEAVEDPVVTVAVIEETAVAVLVLVVVVSKPSVFLI